MIEMGCMSQCPGIMCTTGIEPEAVKYGEQDWSGFHAASIITLTPALMVNTLTVVLNVSKFQHRHLITLWFKISMQSGNKRIVPLIIPATKLIPKFPEKFQKQAGGMHIGLTGGSVKKADASIVLDSRSQIVGVTFFVRYQHTHFPEHNETFQKTVQESGLFYDRQSVA